MSEEPAFPGFHIDNGTTTIYGGMTMRDWFAGQALCGLIMRDQVISDTTAAAKAYSFADEMMKARG